MKRRRKGVDDETQGVRESETRFQFLNDGSRRHGDKTKGSGRLLDKNNDDDNLAASMITDDDEDEDFVHRTDDDDDNLTASMIT
jgi:hypothetical protein